MQRVSRGVQRSVRASGSLFSWASPFLVATVMAVPLFAVMASLLGSDPTTLARTLGELWPRYGEQTLVLMLMVGVFTAAVGTVTAWIVSALEFPGRRLLSVLLVLPLAAPGYIIAYLYTDLLDFAGPIQSALRAQFGWGAQDYWFPEIRSLPGAALMLGLVLYPYVYLLARASFSAQGASQWLAARSLGDTPWRAFRRIALPTARPAIAGGLALVLMETIADYGVADYFAIQTFSVGIFRTWLSLGDRQMAMHLAAMMLGFVALLVLVENLTRPGRTDMGAQSGAARLRMPLSRGATALAWVACGVPVVLGFVIPMGTLIYLSLSNGDAMALTQLLIYSSNSARVAIATALISIAIALLLAYAARQTQNGVVRGGIRLATLGYALPGALLAVGLLAPISGVDRQLTRFLRDSAGLDVGLLLTGSIAVLVYALTIRFLTVGYNSVSGGLSQISPSLDAAARSLGATPKRVLQTIHLPLLSPSLLAGALLVVIDVLRELPATLILRPFNFETLATRTYRLASDERLAEASTAALLIVLMGLIPVILLNRTTRRQDQSVS